MGNNSLARVTAFLDNYLPSNASKCQQIHCRSFEGTIKMLGTIYQPMASIIDGMRRQPVICRRRCVTRLQRGCRDVVRMCCLSGAPEPLSFVPAQTRVLFSALSGLSHRPFVLLTPLIIALVRTFVLRVAACSWLSLMLLVVLRQP